MTDACDIELVFAPQEEGGYHVYAPDLPGLHSEGDTFDEAMENAREALELYVEGLREVGRPLDAGVVRRRSGSYLSILELSLGIRAGS